MLYTVATVLFSAVCVNGQFVSPDPIVEPLSPRGFRVSIRDQPGIQLFAFHGKLNEEMNGREEGTYSINVTKPNNGRWTFVDKTAELKVGDVINFWTSVDYFDGKRKLSYPNDDQTFTVEDLVIEPETCSHSSTTVEGNSSICRGDVIFEDNFITFDESRWIIENYIPKTGPNFEFNSYENTPKTTTILNQKLVITPIAKNEAFELKGTLDLNPGCTSAIASECFHKQTSAYLLPPVKSGKIRSKMSFKFGRIDVRAKLPIGDWIFPDISLVPKDRSNKEMKIVIAYARGNVRLYEKSGSDLGGTLLYAGPMMSPLEPKRSAEMKTKKNTQVYGQNFHIYTLIWQPGEIIALIDKVEFGRVSSSLNSNGIGLESTEYCINIGIGVGGVNDFPNEYRSDYDKPWINKDRLQIKMFFDARNFWKATWKGEEALQVDFVKVTAI